MLLYNFETFEPVKDVCLYALIMCSVYLIMDASSFLISLTMDAINSLQCFIPNQSQLWELPLTLLQKYCLGKSMMAR